MHYEISFVHFTVNNLCFDGAFKVEYCQKKLRIIGLRSSVWKGQMADVCVS